MTTVGRNEAVALLAQLRKAMEYATTDEEVRALTLRINRLLKTIKIRYRIGFPAGLAEQAYELDSKYRLRPHVRYLSRRMTAAVQDVENGHNRMLAVSMPPRSGKSTLISKYGPLWLLRIHPEWTIITSSHDGSLVASWASQDRKLIEDNPSLGIELVKDGGAGSRWDTVEGGGLFSVSVRGALTGRGARVMIIDDPVANFVDAHSPKVQQTLWDWWRSVAYTRLEAPYLVIVVMCMAGDTPVMRPGGAETPLRDIRPGDEVVTYERGQLTTSVIKHWAAQGPDDVFTVTTVSGRSVKANARHPFLVIGRDGVERWVRVRNLRPGHVLAGGSSGGGTFLDEVTSIILSGREDVFDVEVERTHNFLAGGLVSSNTRWHESDFVGRLLSTEYEGDPSQWEVISLPALAEQGDVLGRGLGEPLLSPLSNEDRSEALARIEDIQRSVGTYTFSSMYQQRPAPAQGAIFNSGWWRFWTMDPQKATEDGRVVYLDPSSLTYGKWLDSWDASFKSPESDTGSWVVGQRWVRHHANRYLIAQKRGRWSFTQTIAQMLQWADPADPIHSPCGHLVHERLIEERANGAAIIDVLKEKISGLIPVNPVISKEARARAVTPECESGNVYLPHPSDPGNEWMSNFLSEMRNFPHDVADDQVDSLTQALAGLRVPGRGLITVPGGRGQDLPRRASRTAPRGALGGLSRLSADGNRR